MKKQGYFITFEGNEGCGKTSVTSELAKRLTAEGYEVVVTREPGGVRIAEEIRKLILNPEYQEMDDKTEALLYAAARRQHLVEKVLPAINEGKIVLCDRFVDSSLAYQGYARGIGIDEVYAMNKFAINDVMPNKTFLLEIDYQTGLSRASKRGELDRLEQETNNFHAKVAEAYQIISEKYDDRIVKIDASRELSCVCDEVYKEVLEVINE